MGNQLTLFEIEHAAPAPRHRPHVCPICGRHGKRSSYCSKDCQLRASEPGYHFPTLDIAPPAEGREVVHG